MIYRVVNAESIEELEKDVCALLNDGWILQGGVSMSTSYAVTGGGRDGDSHFESMRDIFYAQALVKI